MDELHELQAIWQGHKPDADINPDTDKITDSILGKIKQTEKKVFRINMAKTILVSTLIITLLWSLRNIQSLLVWMGMGIIAVSTLTMMIIYWRIQFKSSDLNHDLPQNEFIDDTISQMKGAHVKFVKLFRVFVLLLIVGINLLYADLLKEMDMQTRLLFHGGVTVFLVIVFALGLIIRRKKFNREFHPLINELKSLTEQ